MGLLERLQQSDEDIKKIYVIAGTCVVMSAVVFVWLTWFNDMDTLALVPGGGSETAMVADAGSASGFSLWESMRSSAGALWDWATGIIGAKGEYIIEPGQ